MPLLVGARKDLIWLKFRMCGVYKPPEGLRRWRRQPSPLALLLHRAGFTTHRQRHVGTTRCLQPLGVLRLTGSRTHLGKQYLGRLQAMAALQHRRGKARGALLADVARCSSANQQAVGMGMWSRPFSWGAQAGHGRGW